MPALHKFTMQVRVPLFKSFINYLHSEFKNFKLSNKFQTKIKNLNRDEILSIPVFKKFGIVGATGSGKSTTVDIILGLISPQKEN